MQTDRAAAIELKCLHCGDIFQAKKNGLKYCSRSCCAAAKYRRDHPVEAKTITCGNCGKRFLFGDGVDARKRRRYCSEQCSYVARRQRIQAHIEMHRYDVCVCGKRKRTKSRVCKSCASSHTSRAKRESDINDEGMVCSRCNHRRPLSQYRKRSTLKGGIYPYCNACSLQLEREKRANRTPEEKEEYRKKEREYRAKVGRKRQRPTELRSLIRKWGGDYSESQIRSIADWCLSRSKCAMCGASEKLHVDHCHANGRVRGVLCRKCNIAIGLLNEDRERMARAIQYLDGILIDDSVLSSTPGDDCAAIEGVF